MFIKELPVFDLIIDVNNANHKLSNIDPVDEPATERLFQLFNKTQDITFQNNPDQRLAVGPVLVPDRLIYRNDGWMEYYVRISKEQIQNAKKVYFRDGFTDNVQLNHEGEKIYGVYLIDSWTVTNPHNDLSNELGFKNLPIGTWMGTLYFEDEQLWLEYIMSGKLKGFSIQGMFEHQLSQFINVPAMEMYNQQKSQLSKQLNEVQMLLKRNS